MSYLNFVRNFLKKMLYCVSLLFSIGKGDSDSARGKRQKYFKPCLNFDLFYEKKQSMYVEVSVCRECLAEAPGTLHF